MIVWSAAMAPTSKLRSTDHLSQVTSSRKGMVCAMKFVFASSLVILFGSMACTNVRSGLTSAFFGTVWRATLNQTRGSKQTIATLESIHCMSNVLMGLPTMSRLNLCSKEWKIGKSQSTTGSNSGASWSILSGTTSSCMEMCSEVLPSFFSFNQ